MAESSNSREVERIIAEKKERLKELTCIKRTSLITWNKDQTIE